MVEKNIDQSLVTEIALFIDNDSNIYRQRIVPFMKNFARKIDKNKFKEDLAIKGLANNVVPDGVRKYNKEFGSTLRTNAEEKKLIAKNIFDGMKEEICDNSKRMNACRKKLRI